MAIAIVTASYPSRNESTRSWLAVPEIRALLGVAAVPTPTYIAYAPPNLRNLPSLTLHMPRRASAGLDAIGLCYRRMDLKTAFSSAGSGYKFLEQPLLKLSFLSRRSSRAGKICCSSFTPPVLPPS